MASDLLIGPALGAVAAGCTVMLKPSEGWYQLSTGHENDDDYFFDKRRMSTHRGAFNRTSRHLLV
jgi:hypothetical protein